MSHEPTALAPTNGYEHTDVSRRTMLMLAAGFLAILGAAVITMRIYIHSVDAHTAASRLDNPDANVRSIVGAEIDPIAEDQRQIEKRTQRLNTYGWVSKEKRIARIPIDVAMARIVAQNPTTSRSDQP